MWMLVQLALLLVEVYGAFLLRFVKYVPNLLMEISVITIFQIKPFKTGARFKVVENKCIKWLNFFFYISMDQILRV